MVPAFGSSLQHWGQISVRLVAVCATVALVGSMLSGCSDGNDSSNADSISTANAGDGTSCGADDTLEAGLQGDVNQLTVN